MLFETFLTPMPRTNLQTQRIARGPSAVAELLVVFTGSMQESQTRYLGNSWDNFDVFAPQEGVWDPTQKTDNFAQSE